MVFLRKISENAFSPENVESKNQKTNGTTRKCSSRAFQRMVMSVGFDNLNNSLPLTLKDCGFLRKIWKMVPQKWLNQKN
jgi:hypothetical protein